MLNHGNTRLVNIIASTTFLLLFSCSLLFLLGFSNVSKDPTTITNQNHWDKGQHNNKIAEAPTFDEGEAQKQKSEEKPPPPSFQEWAESKGVDPYKHVETQPEPEKKAVKKSPAWFEQPAVIILLITVGVFVVAMGMIFRLPIMRVSRKSAVFIKGAIMKNINKRSLSIMIVVIALAVLLLWTILFIAKLNDVNSFKGITNWSGTFSQLISYMELQKGNAELTFGAESFCTIIFAVGLFWLVNKK